MEGGDVRTVLHFHPALAPVKIGILPLSKKLNEGAEKIYTPSCARSTTANLTTEAISVRDIAVRMKSVRRSALPTTSNPRQTAA